MATDPWFSSKAATLRQREVHFNMIWYSQEYAGSVEVSKATPDTWVGQRFFFNTRKANAFIFS